LPCGKIRGSREFQNWAMKEAEEKEKSPYQKLLDERKGS